MKFTLKTISSLMSQGMSVFPQQIFIIGFICPVLYTFCFVLIVRECFKIIRKMYMSRERDHLEKFSGPTAYPVIGTLSMDMLFTGDFYEWSEKMCKRWGDPLRLWRFGRPVLFISTYTYARQIMLKYHVSQNLDIISCHPRGCKGLPSIPEKKRFPQAFSEQADVEAFIPIFCEESMKLLNELEGHCDTGQAFDVVKPIMNSVFQMICQCNFGETFKTGSYNDNDDGGKVTCYMKAFQTITKSLSSRILNPYIWHMSDSLYYNFTDEGKEMKDVRRVINAFGEREVKRRRFNRTKSRPKAIICNQNCYLDTLIGLDYINIRYKKNTLNDDVIINELNKSVSTFNPISTAISQTLYLLALHPPYQHHCLEEISKMFSKDDISFSSSFLKRMKYLDLCLKESIRLLPSTPILGLRTINDVKLEDGRIIPQDVDVVILCNLVQRDPKCFQEPDRFQPERHDTMLEDSIQFNLIGGLLGEYQAKVILANLIKEYEWFVGSEEEEATKAYHQGLAYPKEGIKLKIRKRNS